MEGKCDDLLSYIANELNATEKIKFNEHLKHCIECQTEYNQMVEIWNTLQLDFDEQEVPKSLKAEVINFVVNHGQKPKGTLMGRLKIWWHMLRNQFTPVTATLVLVLLSITIGLVINGQLRDLQVNATNDPLEIVLSLALTSSHSNADKANGNAFIVQQGKEKKLVIQVNHLPKLEEEMVYQVWLLKDGKRENAGIFKTDEFGSGILTYSLSQNQSFDNIGITLEPDQYSSHPRGEKMVGT